MNVSWNNFQNVTTGMFQQLRTDETFTDVTLVCEDAQQVKAHRVILAAASSFFEAVLVANPSHGIVLYLKGVRLQDLQALLTFIYQGEAEVAEEHLEVFMEAATTLRVRGLLAEAGEGGQGGQAKPQEDSKDSLKSIIGEVNQQPEKKETTGKKKGTKTAGLPVKKFVQQSKQVKKRKENIRNKLKEALKKKVQENLNPSAAAKHSADTEKLLKEEFIDPRKVIDLACIDDVQKDSVGKYPCRLCDFTSSKPYKLKIHMASHDGVKFSCSWSSCDQKYSSIESRKRHEKKVHSEESFACDKCTNIFPLAQQLKAHIVEYHK